jgi:CD63 antigen
MADLSGGAKCVKYTLFVFNLLFLLAGLALIIVGAVAQVQANKMSGFGPSANGAAIFLIVIGSLVFIVSFFGCAGAINNNYCMVVTFGVLLLLLLLAQVAAIIAGFVLKDKIKTAIIDQMTDTQKFYGNDGDIYTETWDNFQKTLQCCGTTNYTSWSNSPKLSETKSVPDSCCKNEFAEPRCGFGALEEHHDHKKLFEMGCNDRVTTVVTGSMIAVGAVAAAVALLEIIGIVFAFCLAHSLRKDYRVV